MAYQNREKKERKILKFKQKYQQQLEQFFVAHENGYAMVAAKKKNKNVLCVHECAGQFSF